MWSAIAVGAFVVLCLLSLLFFLLAVGALVGAGVQIARGSREAAWKPGGIGALLLVLSFMASPIGVAMILGLDEFNADTLREAFGGAHAEDEQPLPRRSPEQSATGSASALVGSSSRSKTPYTLADYRHHVDTVNRYVSYLQDVRDADSAQAQVPHLLAARTELLATAPPSDIDYGSQHKSELNTIRKLLDEIRQRREREMVRLVQTKSLPSEFWEAVFLTDLDMLAKEKELGYSLTPDSESLLRLWREPIKRHGLESVMLIYVAKEVGVSIVEERLKRSSPGCEIIVSRESDGDYRMGVSKVRDRQAILESLIPIGRIISGADGRIVMVGRTRGLFGDGSGPSITRGPPPSRPPTFTRPAPHFGPGGSRITTRTSPSTSSSPTITRPTRAAFSDLDPSAPDYHKKLAERLTSESMIEQHDAIDTLLEIDPQEVTDAEVRKQIARGFKELFEGDHSARDDEVVQGLMRWGGKYSVPILLKKLGSGDTFLDRAILKALPDHPDAEAAAAVGRLCTDTFRGREAIACLRRMGPVAEDVFIKMAPTSDPRLCLTAINALGELGTEKCLSVLRQAVSSRRPDVREAAKAAIQQVVARQEAAKQK
ncbi:MAG: HEAT repeat domain-containing protein [Planctomycetota bacterium]